MAEQRATTTNELRVMPADDLKTQLNTLRKDLWHHRLKARDGSLQQTHVLSRLRRQIARVNTVLREQSNPSAKTTR